MVRENVTRKMVRRGTNNGERRGEVNKGFKKREAHENARMRKTRGSGETGGLEEEKRVYT